MADEQVTDDGVVDELLRIGKADPDGLIQPGEVVAEARDPTSPLHRYFSWDDSRAAHLYRLEQARHLIRRVRIVRSPVPQPAFVNVTIRRRDGSERRGYLRTDRAVARLDLYRQVVEDAQRGLIAYRNRLAAFERGRDLVAAFDALIARVADERGRR